MVQNNNKVLFGYHIYICIFEINGNNNIKLKTVLKESKVF